MAEAFCLSVSQTPSLLIEAMQRRDLRTAGRLIKAHIAQTEKRVLPALKRNAVIVEGRDR